MAEKEVHTLNIETSYTPQPRTITFTSSTPTFTSSTPEVKSSSYFTLTSPKRPPPVPHSKSSSNVLYSRKNRKNNNNNNNTNTNNNNNLRISSHPRTVKAKSISMDYNHESGGYTFTVATSYSSSINPMNGQMQATSTALGPSQSPSFSYIHVPPQPLNTNSPSVSYLLTPLDETSSPRSRQTKQIHFKSKSMTDRDSISSDYFSSKSKKNKKN
eukprot:382679_1